MHNGNPDTGFWAVIRREIGRITAHSVYLAITLIIPLGCYLFFGSMLHGGLPEDMPVGIVDGDGSSTSQMIVRHIDATQQAAVVSHYGSFREAQAAMQRGDIYAFVVIPAGFHSDLLAGRQPEIPFYTEYAHLIAGSLLMKDFTQTLGTIAGGVSLKMTQARGQNQTQAMADIQPIVPVGNEMGNPWVNYSVYLNTTFMPGMLQLMILLTTVLSVGAELKHRTSREWLRTAGGSFPKALAGKVLPYTVIFTLLMLLGDALLFGWFRFPVAGSLVRLCLAGVLFVVAQQALGLLVIGLIPVLRDALSVTAVLGTLAVSLCGLTFPMEGMLSGIQAWSTLFPLRHYYLIYVSEALTAGGVPAAWGAWAALGCFLLLPLLIARRLCNAMVKQNYPVG